MQLTNCVLAQGPRPASKEGGQHGTHPFSYGCRVTLKGRGRMCVLSSSATGHTLHSSKVEPARAPIKNVASNVLDLR
jgi:hypothetical protein